MLRDFKKIEADNCKEKVSIEYFEILWLFLAGSMAGVLIEGTFCLITKGHWESHVISVFAPYNSLYGLGAVIFYVGAAKLKDRSLMLRVLIMMFLATVLELVCGLLLRNALGMKAWSYSKFILNYKGIICLRFSLLWGIVAFVFCLFYPEIDRRLKQCTGRKWRTTGKVLTVLIVIDFTMTSMAIGRWSERHYGITAHTQIEKWMDTETPDEWMQNRFMEWRFLE